MKLWHIRSGVKISDPSILTVMGNKDGMLTEIGLSGSERIPSPMGQIRKYKKIPPDTVVNAVT